jgi:predicted kinase
MESRIDSRHRTQLHRLQTWSERAFILLKNTFAERKRRGFIRECHGDAHLANMIWLNERVILFDCLEFNENLRWIDNMGETAFLTMDLDDRGRPDLARRAVNAYLEFTGDYEGLAVYRFYQVYRALVRAKVACIRLSQESLVEQEKRKTGEEFLGYANLAERYTQPLQPALIITHGLSGSGKTWLSQQLLEAWDVIRVRSDTERKRLHGLAPHARSGSDVEQGIYSDASNRQTYARVAELARSILSTGFPVMVDAAFLKRNQRERLRALAREMHVPFMILDIQVPESLLRERLRQRARQSREVSEANLAVLQRQLATREPLTVDEHRVALVVCPDATHDIGWLVQKMSSLTGAL